jgi:hypothetical protein
MSQLGVLFPVAITADFLSSDFVFVEFLSGLAEQVSPHPHLQNACLQSCIMMGGWLAPYLKKRIRRIRFLRKVG